MYTGAPGNSSSSSGGGGGGSATAESGVVFFPHLQKVVDLLVPTVLLSQQQHKARAKEVQTARAHTSELQPSFAIIHSKHSHLFSCALTGSSPSSCAPPSRLETSALLVASPLQRSSTRSMLRVQNMVYDSNIARLQHTGRANTTSKAHTTESSLAFTITSRKHSHLWPCALTASNPSSCAPPSQLETSALLVAPSLQWSCIQHATRQRCYHKKAAFRTCCTTATSLDCSTKVLQIPPAKHTQPNDCSQALLY
jgi:hypothetical protein